MSITADSSASVASAEGEDRSSYQAVAPWTGLSFGFAKATEGTTWSDSTFAANWANMAKDGLVVRGAYHFFHPSVDPVAQARYFVAAVKARGLKDGDVLAADVEILTGLGGIHLFSGQRAAERSHLAFARDSDAVSWRDTQAGEYGDASTYGAVGTAALAFLEECTSLAGPHVPVIVYTTLSVGSQLSSCTRYPLWIAHPGSAAPASVSPWSKWLLWQWGFGDGSNGGDRDGFNGTVSDLKSWKAGYLPAPPPPPPPPKGTDMAVNGQITGKKCDITYPSGVSTVRFFCSVNCEIAVDLRDGKPEVVLTLGYRGTKSLTLPQGIDGIVVHVNRPPQDGTSISYVVW